LRVAFIRIGGLPWTGGKNYLLNLLRVLTRYACREIQPVVFTGMDCPEDEAEAISAIEGVKVIQTKRFTARSHHIEMACSLVLGSDPTVAKLFRKNSIDLVFESAQYFGWRFATPAIAWIPDFQHRELPEMFSRLYRLKRNFGQGLQIRTRRTVMVSSEDSRSTCERLYPHAKGRIHPVSFRIFPRNPPTLSESHEVARRYQLPKSFFFMPNQFWRHKNHLLVVEALDKLLKRGSRITVAVSGQPINPFAPNHFDDVRKRVTDLGLTDNFRILGLIPGEHIPALLRACSAMLNPSLFEGWSTTVEEARLLGTPMILSDLPVHIEQMGKSALYFNRTSSDDLAERLHNFQARTEQENNVGLAKAQKEADTLARAYARRFVQLVQNAADPV